MLKKLLHHLFLLPVYVGILASACGALFVASVVFYFMIVYWERTVIIIVGIVVIVWAILAGDHFHSHGWRYQRPESKTIGKDECTPKDQ